MKVRLVSYIFCEGVKKPNLIGIIPALPGLYLLPAGLMTGDILTLLSAFMWAGHLIYLNVNTKGRAGFNFAAGVFIKFIEAVYLAWPRVVIFESGLIRPLPPDSGQWLILNREGRAA